MFTRRTLIISAFALSASATAALAAVAPAASIRTDAAFQSQQQATERAPLIQEARYMKPKFPCPYAGCTPRPRPI
jgi:hypothetical protein